MPAQYLDRIIGSSPAVLNSAGDVSKFETTPYDDRIGAQSVYEALQIGASQNPQGAVMNCVRIFANLRDAREPTSGVEQVRSQVIFRENLP